MKNAMIAASGMAVGLVLLQGCATLQVKSDYDPKTTFSSYKTFELGGGTPAPNALAQQRLDDALVATLQSKGLKRVESGGDLKIYSHVRISTETHIDYDSFGYSGYGYRGYGYGWSTGPTSATVREYPVGTLVLDLVDASQKKMVWRGTANDYIGQKRTPEQAQAKAKQVMDKLFANFPPVPAR